MKVTVIGGSNTFSKDNSGFLIEWGNTKIVFDCGDNVFHYLKDNDIEFDAVFLSHTHLDHIGGLEKLIFYKYYIKEEPITLWLHPEFSPDVLPDKKIYYNGQLIEVELFNIDSSYIHRPNLQLIKGNHVIMPNYGLMLREGKETLLITGDTKASPIILSFIENEINNGQNVTVFHDYQINGSSYESFHCCKDDFNYFYSEIKNHPQVQWYLYHNDDFNKKYKNKTIVIGE